MFGYGYVKSPTSDDCISPIEADCEKQFLNIFACGQPTFPCSVKGWTMTTEANSFYCTHHESTCLSDSD